MKSVTLCIPVLNRYDLLQKVVKFLPESTIIPNVQVFNNGRHWQRVNKVIKVGAGLGIKVDVFTPEKPSGVAKAFNWFLRNVPEHRVIMGDDVILAKDSIEKLLAVEDADLVEDSYAFMTIRDSCVAKIGYFDETISPDYGWFEDTDYQMRVGQNPEVKQVHVVTGMVHPPGGSQTVAAFTPAELEEHHRRHAIAEANFHKKWPKKE